MPFHPEASWSDLLALFCRRDENKAQARLQGCGPERQAALLAGLRFFYRLRMSPPTQAPPRVYLLEGQGVAAGGGAGRSQTPLP